MHVKMFNPFSLAALAAVVLASCSGGDHGELVGVQDRPDFYPSDPYGMVYVPQGHFSMGNSDVDVPATLTASTKSVSVSAFYMDETEITNSEYRQFVHWVRDSVIRLNLAEMAELEGKTPDDESGIGAYAYISIDDEDLTPYQKYMIDTYGDDERNINRDVDLIFEKDEYPDELYSEVMDNMYLPLEESYNGQRTWDVNQFEFEYTYMDIETAAKLKGVSRSDVTIKEALNIYPDTTVWIRDFEYSYNEPMHNDYFWHQAYGDYPVVGISHKQAQAFCQWRTLLKNSYKKSKGEDFVNKFRLPNEAEWEYAARGGLAGATYPWGGPYTKNDRGCFMANFKPLRGNYVADQALYTVEADAYEPNDYNLYNMAGNVSEWVMSSYEESSYDYSSTFNPNVNDSLNKRKVVRGGSWKDVAYFLQVSSRDYEYADSARSYIGFRTVQNYMGTDVTANEATN